MIFQWHVISHLNELFNSEWLRVTLQEANEFSNNKQTSNKKTLFEIINPSYDFDFLPNLNCRSPTTICSARI